jgi:hypothetical protein
MERIKQFFKRPIAIIGSLAIAAILSWGTLFSCSEVDEPKPVEEDECCRQGCDKWPGCAPEFRFNKR